MPLHRRHNDEDMHIADEEVGEEREQALDDDGNEDEDDGEGRGGSSRQRRRSEFISEAAEEGEDDGDDHHGDEEDDEDEEEENGFIERNEVPEDNGDRRIYFPQEEDQLLDFASLERLIEERYTRPNPTENLHFGGESEGAWVIGDILVNILRSGDQTRGVIQDVLADGSCKVVVKASRGDEQVMVARPSEMEIVPPTKTDRIKIIRGRLRGCTGKLIGIDGSDCIVKVDDTPEKLVLDLAILAKLAQP